MQFYIDGGVVTDEEIEDAARRFANGSTCEPEREDHGSLAWQ